MPSGRLLSLAVSVALSLSACAAAASTSPSPSSPSPSPSPAGIEHAVGATDLVLRFEEGGGFVPIWFLATQAPTFVLYGDGTVVFQSASAEPPPPAGEISPLPPYRTAKLSEEQVQELLEFALGPGGLGIAHAGRYDYPFIADAPSAFFEVHAGGTDKTVEVYALGIEGGDAGQSIPDLPVRQALTGLAERLRDFDRGGAIATAEYEPAAYRGVLIETEGGLGNVRAWPWPDLDPSDFVNPGDPTGPSFPRRALTPTEVAVLGVGDVGGGFSGITLRGPDEKFYTFGVRPLFPHETS